MHRRARQAPTMFVRQHRNAAMTPTHTTQGSAETVTNQTSASPQRSRAERSEHEERRHQHGQRTQPQHGENEKSTAEQEQEAAQKQTPNELGTQHFSVIPGYTLVETINRILTTIKSRATQGAAQRSTATCTARHRKTRHVHRFTMCLTRAGTDTWEKLLT